MESSGESDSDVQIQPARVQPDAKKYFGVKWCAFSQQYVVKVTLKNLEYLGDLHDNAEEAAKQVDALIRKYNPTNLRLFNFPTPQEKEKLNYTMTQKKTTMEVYYQGVKICEKTGKFKASHFLDGQLFEGETHSRQQDAAQDADRIIRSRPLVQLALLNFKTAIEEAQHLEQVRKKQEILVMKRAEEILIATAAEVPDMPPLEEDKDVEFVDSKEPLLKQLESFTSMIDLTEEIHTEAIPTVDLTGSGVTPLVTASVDKGSVVTSKIDVNSHASEIPDLEVIEDAANSTDDEEFYTPLNNKSSNSWVDLKKPRIFTKEKIFTSKMHEELSLSAHKKKNLDVSYRKSKWIGVYWDRLIQRWRPRIYVECQRISDGSFNQEIDCARAVNKLCRKYDQPELNPEAESEIEYLEASTAPFSHQIEASKENMKVSTTSTFDGKFARKIAEDVVSGMLSVKASTECNPS